MGPITSVSRSDAFLNELSPAQAARQPDTLSDDSPVQELDSLAGSQAVPAGPSVAPAFGEVLQGFLSQVDQAQHRADQEVEALALGEPVDIHQVMLTLNEASNALQLTLQVRGKVLEAYQELMRIPL